MGQIANQMVMDAILRLKERAELKKKAAKKAKINSAKNDKRR